MKINGIPLAVSNRLCDLMTTDNKNWLQFVLEYEADIFPFYDMLKTGGVVILYKDPNGHLRVVAQSLYGDLSKLPQSTYVKL